MADVDSGQSGAGELWSLKIINYVFKNWLEKPFIILAEKNTVHYVILSGLEGKRI